MKIAVATGGTGGHLIPALRVARKLKNAGHEIKICGSFANGSRQLREYGLEAVELNAKGVRAKGLWGSLIGIFSNIKATWTCLKIFRQWRPDRVVGFGGYGSFSAVFAAALMRIPTMIHEQNVVPGKANYLLAGLVKRVAISFKESQKYFNKSKTVLTGCPGKYSDLPFDRQEVLEKFQLKPDFKTLLITGGSQGSRRINHDAVIAIRALKDEHQIQVIHICGNTDYKDLSKQYHQMNIPFALYEYLDQMDQAYRLADAAVTRAGAVTISELEYYQIPAILIPYPYAGAHQIQNAETLCQKGLAQIILERDLTAQGLGLRLKGLLSHKPSVYDQDQISAQLLRSDPSQRLADELLELAS